MLDTVLQDLPLDDLHESPFNPRKTFSEHKHAELVTDIQAQGRVLSPLLVRPRVPALFAGDLEAAVGYEIVFGHRRYRAALDAGMATVPCMVRTMTDGEAKRAQISENLSREDVHPIEEAEGFQALIDDRTHTADSIAAEYGKSRSYVYGRLKLLQACPEIRQACLAGEIGAEAALLVARLRTPGFQQKALGYIRNDYRADLKDGGKASHRAIADMLNEKFTLRLADAIFDTTDETLVPAAGGCPACPKRSGNAIEYADVAEVEQQKYSPLNRGPDVCTDPDCFDAKKRAQLAREAEKLSRAHKVVVTGNAARGAIGADGKVKGTVYVEVNAFKKELAEARRNAHADSTVVPPQVYTIQDPRTGKTIEAVKRTEVKAAGVKLKEPEKRASGYVNLNAPEERRKRAEAEAQWKVERPVRWELFERVRAAIATTERSEFDLQLIARSAVMNVQWNDRELFERLWPNLKTHDDDDDDDGRLDMGSLKAPDLARVLLDCVFLKGAFGNENSTHLLNREPTDLLQAAAHYGVDVAAVRAAVANGTCTPSTAARALEDGASVDEPSSGTAEEIEQTDDAGVAGGSDADVDVETVVA